MTSSDCDTDPYLSNWQDEIESVVLYCAIAEAESQPQLAKVYRKLAAFTHGLGAVLGVAISG